MLDAKHNSCTYDNLNKQKIHGVMGVGKSIPSHCGAWPRNAPSPWNRPHVHVCMHVRESLVGSSCTAIPNPSILWLLPVQGNLCPSQQRQSHLQAVPIALRARVSRLKKALIVSHSNSPYPPYASLNESMSIDVSHMPMTYIIYVYTIV